MSRGGDIRQQILLDMNATGSDAVSILNQAMRELRDNFEKARVEFDENDGSATALITALKGVANGMSAVSDLANHESLMLAKAAEAQAKAAAQAEKAAAAAEAAAERRARAAERVAESEEKSLERMTQAAEKATIKKQASIMQAILDEDNYIRAVEAGGEKIYNATNKQTAADERAAQATIEANQKKEAATEAFIERTVKALEKQDAAEAKLAAQAQARLDARAAKDKEVLDAIGVAADKAAKAADKAAKDMARAAEEEVLAAMRATRAFEETVIPLEALVVSGMKLKSVGIDLAFDKQAAAANAAFVAANKLSDAEEREDAELEKLNQALQANVQLVGKQAAAAFHAGTALDTTDASIKKASGSTSGFGTKAEEAANASKKFGYAAMNVSYAIQDLQYGFPAVINNIGLVTQSAGNASKSFSAMTAAIGGPAGFGAIIMGVGVGVSVLYNNSETFKGAVDGVTDRIKLINKEFQVAADPVGHYELGLKGVEQALKDIEAKPFKLEADYSAIQDITRAIEEMKRAKSEWDAMNQKKSEEEQKATDKISAAVVESGGGHHKLEDILLGIAKRDLDFGMGDTTKMIEAAKKDFEAQSLGTAGQALGGYTTPLGQVAMDRAMKAQAEGDAIRKEMEDAARQQIAEMMTLKGGESSRKKLEVLLKDPRNEALLTGAGIDTSRLGAGVEMAAPDRLFEDERRRIARDKKAQEDAALARQSELEFDQMNRELDKSSQGIKAHFKKIDTTADARIKRAATNIGPGMDAQLQKDMYDALKSGATAEAAMTGQRASVANVVGQRGVAQDEIKKVTEIILLKAVNEAENLIQANKSPSLDVAQGRLDAAAQRKQEALMKALARGAPKRAREGAENYFGQQFQQQTGANDQQAEYAGKQIAAMVARGDTPEQAMSAVYQKMMAELQRLNVIMIRQQAMVLQSQGFAEEAAALLAQLNMKMNMGANNQGRNQQRRPTNQLTFQ